jgi:hypothetical protein
MCDIPPAMMANGRPADQDFDDDEELYRRFDPENLEAGEVTIDAVALPDMSVIRQKYGHPEWLLIHEDFAHWGVLAIRVRDIPPDSPILHMGEVPFVLQPRHVPYRQNYPHSEVWVFRSGVHLCSQDDNLHLLDPDFHLRWRERVVWLCEIRVQPSAEE